MSIYSIKTTKDSDDLDKMIERLRAERIAEENLKKERELCEQHQKMIDETKKNSKKNIETCYDINGNSVSVKKFMNFPDLAKKCGNRIVISSSISDENSNNLKGSFQEKPAKTLLEFENAEPKKKGENEEKNKNLCGVYEKFIPATGVTFTEIGKNQKSNLATISQKVGKFSKNDFYTLQADSYVFTTKTNQIQEPKISETQKIISPDFQTIKPVQKIIFSNKKSQPIIDIKNANPVKISITGDMTQLLVNQNYMQNTNVMEKSVVPQSYIPPAFRSQKSMNNGNSNQKTKDYFENNPEYEISMENNRLEKSNSANGLTIKKPIERTKLKGNLYNGIFIK